MTGFYSMRELKTQVKRLMKLLSNSIKLLGTDDTGFSHVVIIISAKSHGPSMPLSTLENSHTRLHQQCVTLNQDYNNLKGFSQTCISVVEKKIRRWCFS